MHGGRHGGIDRSCLYSGVGKMTWRLAKSLEVLRNQINVESPNRSKISDGTIGDPAHSSRTSDHNPNSRRIVCALDITHDPAHGVDSEKLAQDLIQSRDPRIKYIISNGRITSGKDGPKPWVSRKYTGKNPHNKHVHISVSGNVDSTAPWSEISIGGPVARLPPFQEDDPVLSKGVKGHPVAKLQELLNGNGASLTIDSDFGDKTLKAVKDFQKRSKLKIDGIVGPYTWEVLKHIKTTSQKE